MKQPNEMTDREMDEALATEVMGWTVGGDMFLEPLPSISPSVEPWWDTVIFREDWHPTENLNQAIECAEKYCYRSIDYFLNCGDMASETREITSPRALCEAVLMAKRGEGK